ncbi:UDP-3-O-(3-hydroxymyristoyl)glucosamine N-acyltransferase [Rhizosphaericola mali]|uniref:UDP-3-O-acylglucosamine N-acyltransferase n=1 Tax=Rhizosphaericola mali TaxID=2545455 RepID=A0A5P2GDT5_9BACT|nr:UDP-3-O-(3-hydroxymyristoyl)glucosamine N-acyltransferase [Rhizosphaericola mali]QES89771.1 UDP-3-O-(3-hydroxymyristoyl)glucosamine N-acyltransferase [Rhizosphaericola mali]
MQFTASQLAQIIQGVVEGDENVSVQSFGKIEEAKSGQLSFLSNPKYEEYLYSTDASIVIVNSDLVLKDKVKATLVRVSDSYSAFATLLDLYSKLRMSHHVGIEAKASIHSSAKIGKDVFVADFAYISANAEIGDNVKIYPGVFIGENVKIGDGTVINANVSIYHDCIIGKNVILHAGIVIGSDGFGFAPNPDGSYAKIPQIGNVVIEDNVEIGANTTIDRSTIGSTFIRTGVKLDNLIQIAHNVEVGENTVIAAQAGVSGSSKVGKYVMIGGQVGVVGHIRIADFTKINAQSGVTKSITVPKSSVTGTPAYNFSAMVRSQVLMRGLPDMLKRLEELEKEIELLKNKN